MQNDCRKRHLNQPWALLLLLIVLSVTQLSAREMYQVERIVDGDTIVLSNKQTVRLLGINTPEIGYRGKATDAGAMAAKAYLKALILKQRVWLELDNEREDKYDRTLAHVFLISGEHVNLMLLQQGLATVSIHPPNLKYSKQFVQVQQGAVKQRLGLWGMSEYAVKPVAKIASERSKKWGRFNATVINVEPCKKGVKLWLDKKTYLWIGSTYKRYFSNIKAYQGQNIELRGWPRKWGKYWSIRVIHPSQIIIQRH